MRLLALLLYRDLPIVPHLLQTILLNNNTVYILQCIEATYSIPVQRPLYYSVLLLLKLHFLKFHTFFLPLHARKVTLKWDLQEIIVFMNDE